VRFENTDADGLGEPLPSGVVRVFEAYDGRDVFAGEAEIADRPVGLPVELAIGRAQNVMLEVQLGWNPVERRGRRGLTVGAEYRIVNNKAVAVDLEIRHSVDDGAGRSRYTNQKVDRSSRPMRRKYGDFAWRFVVQPGEELLSYQLSALEVDAEPE
jgi:hypothetical protein